ncbi:hypothetical protein JRO89_XS06G0025000 [Xanthoceras sorbifolium]|uniref:Uncharacterized protein n=1 Tax=Xanthoceras sorbifolium TaxID=99658 RepID=A0ABQ8HW98_9ROSI|nr:hypothetical protein JRO89_XS06G0025000 [Xanthoceras sorbifolium]
MELANKVVSAAIKATNSNAVVNTCLLASFVALSVRSVKQQNHIEALESENESLLNSNKSMKKTMWDWKQQLFAEAATGSASLPLATLKSIYGESSAPGEVVKADVKSSPNKFVV